MKKHHFCVRNGRVDEETAAKARTIAEQYDGDFVTAEMPEGPRFWFEIPDTGEPFTRAKREEIYQLVREAELPIRVPEK